MKNLNELEFYLKNLSTSLEFGKQASFNRAEVGLILDQIASVVSKITSEVSEESVRSMQSNFNAGFETGYDQGFKEGREYANSK